MQSEDRAVLRFLLDVVTDVTLLVATLLARYFNGLRI